MGERDRNWLRPNARLWPDFSSQLINKQPLFFSGQMEASLTALGKRAIIAGY